MESEGLVNSSRALVVVDSSVDCTADYGIVKKPARVERRSVPIKGLV
jgi:hypothetical protein